MNADADSRARTHLANERTFLAIDSVPGFPLVRGLSTVVIATGSFTVLVGLARYRTGRDRIEAEAFLPASGSVTVMAGAALVVAVLGVAFVWLLHEG